MLNKIYSGTVIGLNGMLIDVEVDVAGRGFPTFTIVGLPNKSIDEAKDRVRTAVVNALYEMPDSRITVNLAPADIPKVGSGFDLPIAVGILAASGILIKGDFSDSLFIGELSLEGKVRAVSGILPIALMAREKKIKHVFVPVENAKEAAIIDSLHIYPVANISDLILHLNKEKIISPQLVTNLDTLQTIPDALSDFSEIRGQQQAKRALEIAASGFHNVHLKGAPGAGKTMLSRSFPSILPPLEKEEILEVSKIYSIAGLLQDRPYIALRPFRAPHHTTSRIGLIGGGSHPSPGEISLAHRGVLFLDEFPEFPRIVLEALRQPLEDGIVTISRAAGSLTFPARFLLLAASNPCPCGYLGHPRKECHCGPSSILKYRKRLSGPLLDRIDMHIHVPPVDEERLIRTEQAESSKSIQARVVKARERQKKRFKGSAIFANSEMGPTEIKKYCQLTDKSTNLLKQAISKLSLSARSYFKIIKLSQTIADLAGDDTIEVSYVAEALQYRVKEE